MAATLSQLTTPQREIVLPSGLKITIAQVTLARWQPMLAALGNVCATLQAVSEQPLTEDALRTQVPALLISAWTYGQSEEVEAARLQAANIAVGIAEAQAAMGEVEPGDARDALAAELAEVHALHRQLLDGADAMVAASRAGVLEFLGCFLPGLTAETLDALQSVQDWEALWREVWEDNRIPFGQHLGRLRARLAALLSATRPFASGSTAPESTPETPASP